MKCFPLFGSNNSDFVPFENVAFGDIVEVLAGIFSENLHFGIKS